MLRNNIPLQLKLFENAAICAHVMKLKQMLKKYQIETNENDGNRNRVYTDDLEYVYVKELANQILPDIEFDKLYVIYRKAIQIVIRQMLKRLSENSSVDFNFVKNEYERILSYVIRVDRVHVRKFDYTNCLQKEVGDVFRLILAKYDKLDKDEENMQSIVKYILMKFTPYYQGNEDFIEMLIKMDGRTSADCQQACFIAQSYAKKYKALFDETFNKELLEKININNASLDMIRSSLKNMINNTFNEHILHLEKIIGISFKLSKDDLPYINNFLIHNLFTPRDIKRLVVELERLGEVENIEQYKKVVDDFVEGISFNGAQ